MYYFKEQCGTIYLFDENHRMVKGYHELAFVLDITEDRRHETSSSGSTIVLIEQHVTLLKYGERSAMEAWLKQLPPVPSKIVVVSSTQWDISEINKLISNSTSATTWLKNIYDQLRNHRIDTVRTSEV